MSPVPVKELQSATRLQNWSGVSALSGALANRVAARQKKGVTGALGGTFPATPKHAPVRQRPT